MRLATNTRYTLCTIKSVYIYHEWHVVAAMHPSCLASPKSGGTGIPRAYRVEFVVNAPLVVPTQNLITVTPDITSKLPYCTT